MSKDEIIQALNEGKRVTHTRFFGSGEFMYLDHLRGCYVFPDGQRVIASVFWWARTVPDWSAGWEIFDGEPVFCAVAGCNSRSAVTGSKYCRAHQMAVKRPYSKQHA